jgi:hypothetical protein
VLQQLNKCHFIDFSSIAKTYYLSHAKSLFNI